MPSNAIPANAVLYKAGSSMTVAGGIAVADALLLVGQGALMTGFAVPTMALLLMGSYGVLAGMMDFAKWRRARHTPALLLTPEGIIDATGIVTGGLVHWSEISGVREVHINGTRSLALDLYDTDAYLARLPEWKRSLLAGNVRAFGSPCLIAQSDLAVPLDQAREAIENAWHARQIVVPQAEAPAPSAHWWTAIPPEERQQTIVGRGR